MAGNQEKTIEQLELECFFPIEVEHLNHIQPKYESRFSGLNPLPEKREESLSKKYLVVLDSLDRSFLGLKRYYKSMGYNIAEAVKTNQQVDGVARLFLHFFVDPKRKLLLTMRINDEKNKFFSNYFGTSLKEYFEKENGDIWKLINKNDKAQVKFNELKSNEVHFEIFLEDEFHKKLVYVSSSNGYDLKNYPTLNIGIVDQYPTNKNESKFIHLIEAQIKTNDWIPAYAGFKASLIEYIKNSFILSQTKIKDHLFIPILFDLANIHFDRAKLERTPEMLAKAISLKQRAEKYIDDNVGLTYYNIYRFISETVSFSKQELDSGPFAKIANVFSKSSVYKKELNYLVDKNLIDEEARMKYENDVMKGFESIKSLL
jgi:hypothetical protein